MLMFVKRYWFDIKIRLECSCVHVPRIKICRWHVILILRIQQISLSTTMLLSDATNTVQQSNGELLTGNIWRKEHPFINDLPFYSNIIRADDIGAALREWTSPEEWYGSFLVVSNLAFSILISLLSTEIWMRMQMEIAALF